MKSRTRFESVNVKFVCAILWNFAFLFCMPHLAYLNAGTLQSKTEEYAIYGRVVDGSGHPVGGVNVWVTPIYGKHSKNFDLLEVSQVTDSNGSFRVTVAGRQNDNVYLCTSVSSKNDKLLLPPFSFVTERDKRLLGQPLILAKSKEINLGDVQVLFYFGDVQLEITYKGKSLKASEWNTLWLVLENEKNVMLTAQSIGPTIDLPVIDLVSSTASYSLPEGKYRIKLRSINFDETPQKIGSALLGSTGIFEVERNKMAKVKLRIVRSDKVFSSRGRD